MIPIAASFGLWGHLSRRRLRNSGEERHERLFATATTLRPRGTPRKPVDSFCGAGATWNSLKRKSSPRTPYDVLAAIGLPKGRAAWLLRPVHERLLTMLKG